MKLSDKQLGMDRDITRRDFINGVAAVTTATAIPGSVFAASKQKSAANYPPLRTGLRGSHVGSFEVAHELTWAGRKDWGPVEDLTNEAVDLLIVGAGLSGLAAAHFYRAEHPDARILLLDNHDDFGGHAKRNEFEIDGHTVIGYGGSQTMEEPGSYNRATRNLLHDLGIDLARFEQAYDRGFLPRFGLSAMTWFDAETFGVDRLVDYSLIGASTYLPVVDSKLTTSEAVRQMPLGENARAELLRLLTTTDDVLKGMSLDKQWEYLESISYREFLEKHLDITDAELFELFQGLTTDSTVSIEMSPADSLLSYVGLPGANATGLVEDISGGEPYIHHFPDGNASIARLLVRKLIPGVAPGSTMDDIVLANIDYAKLDRADTSVRLRLNSTVVNVEHDGPADSAQAVSATYVRGGKAYRVRATHCVMACYNAMIPHICPELPEIQSAALKQAIKAPILYTSVLLRNWRAWEKLGVGFFASPGDYHAVAMLDFPVSMGGYSFSPNPDEPMVVHLERFEKGDDHTAPAQEQALAGRRKLYATPFETIERNTRQQLAGALAGGGFDPATDIAAITANRWGHGYAYSHDYISDPDYRHSEQPNVVGRQRLGRITIANSDAGASATVPSAVGQASRAVAELADI